MINLVVALPAEARPLIEHYRLGEKTTLAGFSIYRRAQRALIISGPGKVAAAAATALLAGSHAPAKYEAAWLNIGIAGHATCALGDSLLAHRITDDATGKSWYPPQLFDLATATRSLLTVDMPENSYRQDVAYDMEASGFYPVAGRFSSHELVQCFKVVSDNRRQSSAAITAAHCTQLITQKLDEIDQLVGSLESLARDCNRWYEPHSGLEQLTAQWHFTVSQQHQLAELARRWRALIPNQPLWLDELAGSNNAATVLHCLRQHLDSLATGTVRSTLDTGV
jgi:adenosylhomocysteine nucleosidase